MYKVALVAAMEREVRPLVKHWRAIDKDHSGRHFRFFEHEDVVAVAGGIGPEAARRAAEAVIVLYSPQTLFSVGYAGGLSSELKVGDVFRPARVIDAADCSSVLIAGGEGVLVSSATVVGASQKAKLREAFQAHAVDMEAAAVARAAQARGVEFFVVKAVSDEFDFELPSTERFVDADGHFREAGFALFVAIRPWLWPRMMRLARNGNCATRALCDELRRIVGERRSSKVLNAVDRQ